MVRCLETERPLAVRYPEYNPRQFQAEDEELMLMGRDLTICRSLYEKAALDFPMTCSLQFLSVGSTSADFKISLMEDSTGVELVSSISKVVCVKMANRAPAKVPEEMKMNYFSKGLLNNSNNLKFEKFDPLVVPDYHFQFRLQVMHDDLDCLFHVNQAVYTRFAENCAAAAVQAGFYTHFKEDICFYLVHKYSVLHVGESFAGDHLDVCTWQDEADDHTVYFVFKREGKDICYLKFIYFQNLCD